MRLLAIASLTLAFSATAADVRETRTVADFTEVSLSAPVDVHVTQGAAAGVVLEGDSEALARIETVVEAGRLEIRIKPRNGWGWKRKVTARVTAPRIEALAIAGSGDITAPSLSGQRLRVAIAGSGDVRVGGKVEGFTASIAGSGDIRAGDLEATDVKVSIAGSGDATVRARQSLAVTVSGSGAVRYFGEPAVRQSILGSGSVRRARPASS